MALRLDRVDRRRAPKAHIPGQLATLAAVLDLPGATGVDTDADKVAREVLAELGRTERFWLLVFDNAEHADRLRQWLPRESAGHVIVTSRHRGWDGLAATIDVDVLDRPDSVALLRNSLPSLDGQVADGAVKAAEEAVSLYRQLIAVDRSAHLPNFAASVNNLALRLGEVGRWA